jgi:flavin-dependent thymidylate synthase
MKVTLIDYTGAGSPDPWYAAKLLAYTKNTRLEQGEETRKRIFAMPEDLLLKELDYISKTIRSSWEFVDYTFEIKDVTRAFTHQLVRTRTASYAQQAQRVVDMSYFETLMPEAVLKNDMALNVWNDVMRHIRVAYMGLKDCGIAAQDCRGVLPTNVFTNIIMKVNLRTLADLLAKRKNLRAQGEYADVAREWERLVLEIHPWTKPFLDPERTQTPALDLLLKDMLNGRAPIDAPNINEALKELDALKEVWG